MGRYSCIRKLSKSSSVGMISPESDVNSFQKSKMNRNAIAEKIAALQTNGEISWKKRVPKLNLDKVIPALNLEKKEEPPDQNDNVELRRNNKDNSSIIANRLSQLESSQETWKRRVEENDANIFTVQGRLEKAGKFVRSSSVESPTTPTGEPKVKGFKIPTPLRVRSKASESSDSVATSPTTSEATKCDSEIKSPVKFTMSKKEIRLDPVSSSDSSDSEKVIRSVARNDNETFSKFFDSNSLSQSSKQSTETKIEIDETSFTAIHLENRKLLGMKRNIKAPRNHSNVRNPVKSLASRLENSEQAYSELNPQVREKEMKRIVQTMNNPKSLTLEALKALASKENFGAVKLKKASAITPNQEYPYPMLISIKGKRQVQTRLVEPVVSSLNSGDIAILITGEKIFQFIGEFSNRLERAKLNHVVTHIVKKKDMGCRLSSLSEVITLEEPVSGSLRDRNQFFDLLGGGSIPEAINLGDETDELYESSVVSTNCVYQVDDVQEKLVPLEDSPGWSSLPRYSILHEDKVLVFDFQSEMYVWSGKLADPELKRTGYRLAKKLFQQPYTCSGNQFDPIGESSHGKQRPNWCWLKKISQHMEPILFIDKFFDWPEQIGAIRVQQKRASDSSDKDASYNFKPCNVDEMLQQFTDVPDPKLELEGFDVGRGSDISNTEERRHYIINTVDVKAWNISEFSKSELNTSSLGHFYSGETYVVRWQYSVTQIGRDLKGNKSRHSGVLGRERCCYFYWHGKDSRITEQGTSALMTVELDQERGPQIRVEQSREPPAFMSLFKGLMLIHLGPKENANKDKKLYIALGALETEGHFVEVEAVASSFRTLGSFILVDFIKKRLFVWHGSLSNDITRNIAETGAAKFIEESGDYLHDANSFQLIKILEGEEPQAFLTCLNVSNTLSWGESYSSLSGRNPSDYADVNVFAFSSLQGSFESQPVYSCKRKSGSKESFPLLQEDLYNSQQRFFLICRGPETWLWEGRGGPRGGGDEENENTVTGSEEIRSNAERKAALETTLEFSKRKGTGAYLVSAGMEPILFTNIFPYWNAQDISVGEDRSPGVSTPVEEALKKYLKANYTLEELQSSERPDGVDHSKLETYLKDEDFVNVLKMTKEEFSKLSKWRQTELKKAVGLF